MLVCVWRANCCCCSWVVQYKGNVAQERILMVTPTFLLTAKSTLAGVKLCKSFHLYQLTRMEYLGDERIDLMFGKHTLEVACGCATDLATCVSDTVFRITQHIPADLRPQLLSAPGLLDIAPPRLPNAEAFVECFVAHCELQVRGVLRRTL
jgi:hypothetical protein